MAALPSAARLSGRFVGYHYVGVSQARNVKLEEFESNKVTEIKYPYILDEFTQNRIGTSSVGDEE